MNHIIASVTAICFCFFLQSCTGAQQQTKQATSAAVGQEKEDKREVKLQIPAQKQGDFELRIVGLRTATEWSMFPGHALTVKPKAGETLVIVEFSVRDLRSGKDDTGAGFKNFELEDQQGTKYKSPIEITDLREIPFSVPNANALKFARIAGLTFEISELAKSLRKP